DLLSGGTVDGAGATDTLALVEAHDDAALAELESRLRAFETAQSEARRRLFDRIDSLTAELVRRYRDGGASVDTLLEG
ncbi:MAG: hypothetical protein EBX99_11510, partial [Acidimicrobiia bacterium]|nr:hypothetical protein [Acidimicrobiia bacterium]